LSGRHLAQTAKAGEEKSDPGNAADDEIKSSGADRRIRRLSRMGYTEHIITQNLPPARAFNEILKAIWIHHPETPPRLSMAERGLMLVWEFHRLIFVDGLHGYFINTDCNNAHDTTRAFELFGMQQEADILKQALALAQVPDPVPDSFILESSESQREALDKLEKEYWHTHTDISFERTLVDFVGKHPEQFV
jgi:hypothetical protein